MSRYKMQTRRKLEGEISRFTMRHNIGSLRLRAPTISPRQRPQEPVDLCRQEPEAKRACCSVSALLICEFSATRLAKHPLNPT